MRTELRDPTKSSEFGRWINSLPDHVYHFLNGDGLTYAKSTKTLRFLEIKNPRESLTDSQLGVLPLLASLFALASVKLISRKSGVFIIRGLPPYETYEIEQVAPGTTFSTQPVEWPGTLADWLAEITRWRP